MGDLSGWWVLGPIMMILFWGGLFWLAARMLSGRQSPATVENADVNAKEIAARRFASGEIDETEFTRISGRLER